MSRLTTAFLTLCIACGLAHADILQVPTEYPTIQAAIDAAADGDEVWVLPGTYFERIDLLGKEILVRSTGGADVTTIDGQQGGTVITCGSGETLSTVIEGFTVSGGEALEGAGMRCIGSSITIRDSIFRDNNATDEWPAQPKGGAIYAENVGEIRLERCDFTGNSARASFDSGDSSGEAGRGGVIYCTNGMLRVEDSLFSANRAPSAGGAIWINGAISVLNCEFRQNNAISQSTSGNYSDVDGEGGALYLTGQALIEDSVFENNRSGDAGAIYGSQSLEILRSTFVDNRARAN